MRERLEHEMSGSGHARTARVVVFRLKLSLLPQKQCASASRSGKIARAQPESEKLLAFSLGS